MARKLKADPTPQFLPHEQIPSALPIICEPLYLLELAMLRLSPVYYGSGVPAGDGSAVVVIPGLLCADSLLVELYSWLARIGYRPYFSGMDVVEGCPNRLATRLARTITRAYADTGRRVHLIGHSLGGIFARSAAVRMPDFVSSVITLGTPFRGLVMHGVVIALAEMARDRIREKDGNLPDVCATSHCTCAFGRSLRRRWPKKISQTAVYTTEDGLVHWRYCITGIPRADVEVHGTHLGLIFNPVAYTHIAQRLSERPPAS
ncbi:MAG: hypothetical protein ACR2IF_03365 [Terriglobales bacterium]